MDDLKRLLPVGTLIRVEENGILWVLESWQEIFVVLRERGMPLSTRNLTVTELMRCYAPSIQHCPIGDLVAPY